jgi:hypothetical protein
LEHCPLRKEGCPIGSRSVAEAWLFGFWARRLGARLVEINFVGVGLAQVSIR